MWGVVLVSAVVWAPSSSIPIRGRPPHRSRPRQPPQGVVPPADYNQWSKSDKIRWLKGNLDLAEGSEVAHWWDEYRSKCYNAECIRRGGMHTRVDAAAPYQCRAFQGLHPDGVVAWVRIAWERNNYTGLFKAPARGLARWGFNIYNDAILACAANNQTFTQASKGGRESGAFLALKLFRDGVPSANMHSTDPLGGSGSWNIFNHNYTNLFPGLGADGGVQGEPVSMTEQGAMRGTKWPGFTGLHDLAMYDAGGSLEHGINFPYQLLFFPTDATTSIIPDNPCIGDWNRFIELFSGKIAPRATLYNIYAKDSHLAPMVKIGSLRLESRIMTSGKADRQLFFYHNRFDRDLELRPELAQGQNCQTWASCPACPLHEWMCSPDEAAIKRWSGIQSYFLQNMSNSTRAGSSSMAVLSDRFGVPSHPPMNVVPPKINVTALRKWRRIGPGSSYKPVGGYWDGNWSSGSSPSPLPGPVPGAAAGFGSEMRADDPYDALDTLSSNHYNPMLWCDRNGWPRSLRQYPGGPPPPFKCASTPAPGRPQAEPQFEVQAGCGAVPQCSKTDGTWYSDYFPCQCGSATCTAKQLCTSWSSTCQDWDPLPGRRNP